jgi:hypothetical protein
MRAFIARFFLWMACLSADVLKIDGPGKITSEWEERALGIKYGVTTLDKAVHEMVNGLISDIFDEAFIKKISEAIKKQPTGESEFIDYWDNGTLKAKLPFKDGKAHGHLHGWYENGADAFKGHFCDGVKQGVHITFYKSEGRGNGNKARRLTYSVYGKLDGDQQRIYQNGRLWLSSEYENGLAHGSLEAWDEKQKQYLSVDYKKGFRRRYPPPAPARRRKIVRHDCRYVGEAIREFEKVAANEFGVFSNGSGAGMPNDVESISVSLTIYKKGVIEEARELIVKLTERFVEIINKHEKLRPYLREYPFTHLRAHVSLGFSDKSGMKYQDGSIAYALIGSSNQVFYCISEPNSHMLTDFFDEPYAKALEIVRAKDRERASLEMIKK